MSNIIRLNEQTPIDEWISMSNSLTSVFVDVLTLSGSHLAVTDDEKRLIVWISEKDQSRVGIGTVGFDICEMPWNPITFEDNKKFLLNVIYHAKNRFGWELLEYKPNEDFIFYSLDQFAVLINKMCINDIQQGSLEKWLDYSEDNDPIFCGFPKCKKHNTLLTCFGCHICNNWRSDYNSTIS